MLQQERKEFITNLTTKKKRVTKKPFTKSFKLLKIVAAAIDGCLEILVYAMRHLNKILLQKKSLCVV